MLHGLYHPGDPIGSQRLRLVLDILDLEPDPIERLDDLGQRRSGVEMLLEPGDCEFQGSSPQSSEQEALMVSRTLSRS